ncbi:MAG: efflux RND transporter periplasmic adaptor subunit [Gammaproteobacteria bacterium]
MDATNHNSSPIYSALAVLGLSLALTGCAQSGAHPAAAPTATRSVRAVPVQEGVRGRSIRAVGVLEPKDKVTLAFKVGGVVARVAVHEGDAVRRGTVLAELDGTEIGAAVARAAQVEAKATRDRDRTKTLYADDVATLEQLEDTTTALEVARTDLSTARFNARYARIEAPADGFVVHRSADPSALVAAGQPVLVVGSLADGWQVRAAVADRDVVRLAIGDSAQVTFDAFPGQAFAARVLRLAAASDAATGTYDVELAVEPKNAPFVQGLVAKVELAPSAAHTLQLTVPVEALLEADGAHATVFVLESTSAARRRIEIGELIGNRAEVREGLAAGEQVITEGASWISDGESVTVVAERN